MVSIVIMISIHWARICNCDVAAAMATHIDRMAALRTGQETSETLVLAGDTIDVLSVNTDSVWRSWDHSHRYERRFGEILWSFASELPVHHMVRCGRHQLLVLPVEMPNMRLHGGDQSWHR